MKWNNIGPYIAERLIYFRRSQGELDRLSNHVFEAHKGKIIISGLEFKLNSIGKEFVLEVSPIDNKDWLLFKNQVRRTGDPEFWNSDEKIKDMKKRFEESKYFLREMSENFKDHPNKYVVKGKFGSFNESDAYYSILNRFVKPLILYRNFLTNSE